MSKITFEKSKYVRKDSTNVEPPVIDVYGIRVEIIGERKPMCGIRDDFFVKFESDAVDFIDDLTGGPDCLYYMLVDRMAGMEPSPLKVERIAKWINDLKPYLDRRANLKEQELLALIDEHSADHLYLIFFIQADMLRTLVEKGVYYGPSFKKKGWFSIFHNLQRKYDPIENILFEKYIKRGDDSGILANEGKGLEEAFRDEGNYSMLAWTYLLEELTREATDG